MDIYPLNRPENKTVLIIDQNPLSLDLMNGLLINGINILLAKNTNDCDSQFKSQTPDLIVINNHSLSDEYVAIDKCYALCRHLRNSWSLGKTKIILTSPNNSLKHKLDALEAGCDDFIAQPISCEALIERIKAALGKFDRDTLTPENNANDKQSITDNSIGADHIREFGLINKMVRHSLKISDLQSLANLLIKTLDKFNLLGKVKIVTRNNTVQSISKNCSSTFLEDIYLDALIGKSSYRSIGQRFSVSTPQVCVTVRNMPTDDPELCPRLEDHVIVLVSAIAARVDRISSSNVTTKQPMRPKCEVLKLPIQKKRSESIR